MNEKIQKVREVILELAVRMNLTVEKIIIFGSRAKGDFDEGSDLDIIVTKSELSENLFWKFYSSLSDKLVRELNSPVDLIIVSKNYFEEKRNEIGKIYYLAEREGLIVV